MKISRLFLIALLQVAFFTTLAQNIDDLLERENKNVPEDQTEAITMTVDRDVSSNRGQGDASIVMPDSLERVNDKWKTYLLVKNEEIQQISSTIQQKEFKKIKKEEIEGYILQINNLKKDFDNRKETNGIWQANDDLDDLRKQFDLACEKELLQLNQWKETKKANSIPGKFLAIGITLLIVMVGLPIFNQVKASTMVKKAKKLQALQAKLQMEQNETQKLLSDDSNIITLNSKL
jgi:hypothetical protein